MGGEPRKAGDSVGGTAGPRIESDLRQPYLSRQPEEDSRVDGEQPFGAARKSYGSAVSRETSRRHDD